MNMADMSVKLGNQALRRAEQWVLVSPALADHYRQLAKSYCEMERRYRRLAGCPVVVTE